MEKNSMHRREFVKTAALAAMYVPRRAFDANDRISLGLVGPGSRAQALMEIRKSPAAEMPATG